MGVSVYCGQLLIYSTTIDSLKLIAPKVTQEVNKTGSFEFSIYPDHPYYDLIHRFTDIITVYDDGISEPLFRGRIVKDEKGFYNEKKVTCEGELAFLLDSVQRPYSFPAAGYATTPEGLLKYYIDRHNAQVSDDKKFTVGTVTVTDPNGYITRSNSDYSTTWNELTAKLVNSLGGYLWTRHVNGVNYIDYLSDFTTISNQKIEFGSNLLELTQTISADSFATAVIPLGAKDKTSGKRLTIESVNNNVDYVYNAEAVKKYGYIFTTQTWDDVTVASNLKVKGQAYIDGIAQFTASINVSAADLNGTGVNVNSFRIGRYVTVESNPHGISQNFVVSKLSRQLDKPEATRLTLGASFKTLTEKQHNTNLTISDIGLRIDSTEQKVIQLENGSITVSDTEPESHETSWLDTSVNPPLLKRYAPEYLLLVAEPSDWTSNYTSYFTFESSTGTYSAVAGSTAPEWEEDTYYQHTEWITVNDTTQAFYVIEKNLSVEISKSETNIMSRVSEDYYLKDETDSLISSVSTTVEQNKNSVDILFNQYSANLEDLSENTDTKFEEIKKYIRFINGKILLGEVGNELELQIANDRISFLQSNSEVAYFSNNKLYITDGEYTNSLVLGQFAFLPRSNGNLSFKKLV